MLSVSVIPFTGEYYSFIWIYYSSFNRLPIDGHLGCFYFSSVTKNSVDICVQIIVWLYIYMSFGWMPRNGIAGSYGKLVFNF